MTRGRKPTPTKLKLLSGNPGHRRLNDREPVAPADVPDCPEYLDDVARGEWHRTVAVLSEMGLASRADRSALAAYCTAYSRWVEAEQQVRRYGTIVKAPNSGFPMKSPYLSIAEAACEQMRKLLVEFGLTPSSRSRIRLGDRGPNSNLDDFLEEGRSA
jgi:P27 family predicted phage terminase small subunit